MSNAIWICAMGALAIFGIMLHSVATFRGGATRLRRHAIVEIVWALVPILIVVAAAAPSLRHAGGGELVIASRAAPADEVKLLGSQ